MLNLEVLLVKVELQNKDCATRKIALRIVFLVNMVTGVFAHRSVAEEYNQERGKLCKMLKTTALHVVNKY